MFGVFSASSSSTGPEAKTKESHKTKKQSKKKADTKPTTRPKKTSKAKTRPKRKIKNSTVQDSHTNNPQNWVQRKRALLDKFSDNQFLLKHHLGQLELEQERLRGTTTASSPPPQAASKEEEKSDASSTHPTPGQLLPKANKMSEAQRLVADSDPSIPLSVRAGAGTGKTQTMVTRAIRLCTLHGLDPARILMLTFTNRAAEELNERIKIEFDALPLEWKQRIIVQQQQERDGNKQSYHPQARKQIEQAAEVRLPTVKTFHSLAYRWIGIFWKRCGLGKHPNLQVTPAQQKSFMKQVIQAHVHQKKMKRCYKYLGMKDEEANKHKTLQNWESIVRVMGEQFPDEYQRAHASAEGKLFKGKKKKKATTTNAKKQGETETREEGEQRLLLRMELERQCYLELLRWHKGKPKATCDLESRWPADTDNCNMYLKMVEQARLGQHQPREYLPKDADILKAYERMQARTGNIDFDKLLNLFIKLLKDSPPIRNSFHKFYNYVIVDEYQDNSEVQSNLLLKMVTKGRVTVVGDDDQCIYQFRGASPGNFESFQRHYASQSCPSSQSMLLEANYRSTANILVVGNAFLQGMSFQRGKKILEPTRQTGDKVLFWNCADDAAQARRIAQSARQRHDQHGVSWGQMACLFRCFQKVYKGKLHTALQQEFAMQKIPFRVVGGDSFLNSEIVRDLLAYMKLTLTGSPERQDDDSFARVLNKPPRGLPQGALDLIRAQQDAMNKKALDGTLVGLEEAAEELLRNNSILTKGRRNGLDSLFSLLHDLRVAAVSEPLPELVLSIWNRTGLASWHGKKAAAKERLLLTKAAIKRNQN